MNYEKFYKMADATNSDGSQEKAPAGGAGAGDGAGGGEAKSTDPKWNESIDNVQGWNEPLPMLALLAGTGALGGWALSAKKKKGAGAAYGAISLPALYAMYVASRRNKILPSGAEWDDPLDKAFNKVNDK